MVIGQRNIEGVVIVAVVVVVGPLTIAGGDLEERGGLRSGGAFGALNLDAGFRV